ncbi:MAG TPA: hypothetical protein VF209_04265 [Patescibacteria group bacterium]
MNKTPENLQPNLDVFEVNESEGGGEYLTTEEIVDMFHNANWWRWSVEMWQLYLDSLTERKFDDLSLGEKALKIYGEEVLKADNVALTAQNDKGRIDWINHFYSVAKSSQSAA